MRKIQSLIGGILLLAGILACSDEKTETVPTLEVNRSTVDFANEGGMQNVGIITNVDTWSATSNQSWCIVSPNGKMLKIEVLESNERSVREAEIVVKASGLDKSIKVRQLGYDAAILVSNQLFSISAAGGEVAFDVTTNVEVEVTTILDWMKPKLETRATPGMVKTAYKFTVDARTEDMGRSGAIMVKEVGDPTKVENLLYEEILVTQKGLKEFSSGTGEDIKDDIKLKIVSGEASSYHVGEGIDKSFDVNYGTIYHSNWSDGKEHGPITLTYNLETQSDVDYLVYHPRTDGTNGLFKVVDIEYSADGASFQSLKKDYDFKGSSSATRVYFNQTVKAKSFRFTVKSGAGDNNGWYASCAEMEFYAKDPRTFDYSTLFEDETCSELKNGLTPEEIQACEYPFFKNIAYYMSKDAYPRDFRIATFKAYPNPDIQGTANKTNHYSRLDNPTGIFVKNGETLIVMVGDTHGYNISLRVQNLDKPGGDGFGGETYPLFRGVNKLTMRDKGLVYVIYHTPTLGEAETADAIKIHFASGTVNGYFDSQKHTRDQWNALLNNATDKYFDLLGEYAHLTFETAQFKSITNNGYDLIGLYDKLVYSEQQLLGLEKYDKMFKNRMYFNVMYHQHMYATNYHTGYNANTISNIGNEEVFKTTGCWGPAHEVGHCNQTRPGLKWLGTTEVTNNIMSEYIQTVIFKQNSRIQTEDMGVNYRNRYSKAWNGILVSESPHGSFNNSESDGDDVFCKLIPFWQLQLYFGNALGRTPLKQEDKGGFYPDVYEYIRTNSNLTTAGAQQLEFAFICSKISGYDLTDFFAKWGFFTPVDVEIDDYGKGKLTVTQKMIDDVKKRITQLPSLSKLEVALEYITDNTWELYKTKPQVIKGTARRQENKITMSNWQNVVAYEVRNESESGELIFVSDGVLTPSTSAWFTLTSDWKDGYKVYAVAVDGKRTEVTF